MGCSHSTMNEDEQLMEFYFTELSIAKRPGGSEIGPVRKFERISDGITRRASEMKKGSGLDKKKLPSGTITFSIVKVVADKDGVLFYHFCGSSVEDPTNQLHIAKRYTDFETLYTEMSKVMAKERIVSEAPQHLFNTQPALPEIPKANVWTYLHGNYNEEILKEREEQFTRILNAITRHPVAFQSTSFTNFLFGTRQVNLS
ncbi:unnamed protein product [Peronospora destructor]|uniref:PX domain-containing protein n=1 Tax=Peronospora destructor TaxID=86335 RepID=A0AAV0VCX9_9STRA|nr:unnamed protein product [Peronospora destructor]